MRDQETQGRQKAEQMSGSIPVVGSDFAFGRALFSIGPSSGTARKGKNLVYPNNNNEPRR